jgi:cytochrome b6-f complex iron-sulfur subunit
MSCQDCVTRREFLAKSAAAAAALVAVEGCGDGQIGGPGIAPSSGTTVVTLASTPALANVGTVVSISPDRALVRTGATTFAAFSMICTHEGCLTEINTQRNRFECPCHQSIFSNAGAVVQGPADRPLETLTAAFNATAGTVTVS